MSSTPMVQDATVTPVASPDPKAAPQQQLSPEYTAGILSRAVFAWVDGLFRAGNRRPLQQSDLFKLGGPDDVGAISAEFERGLHARLAAGDAAPTRHALTQQFKAPMLRAGVWKFANSTVQFAPPLLLQGLLNAIADQTSSPPTGPAWAGYVWAVGLFVAMTLRVGFENQYFHRVVRVGFHMRSALSAAVYKKALRMSPVARQDTPVGKLVNLMQLDASRMEALTSQLHVVWDSPYQILGYMVLLGIFLGWAALAGLASMLLLIPLQIFAMTRMGRRRAVIAKATDQRIKVTNEALQGVRTLKQYNWEDAYEAVIAKAREAELAAIWQYSLINSWNMTLVTVAPILVGMVTLLVFAGTGGSFTAANVFAALSVLNSLRFPLMFLPSVMSQLADARVSLSRLDRFFSQPEVEALSTMPPPSPSVAVSVAPDASESKGVPDVAADGPSGDTAAADVPARLRQPMAAGVPDAECGIAVRGATFYHEEPATRRERVKLLLEDKRKEDEAAAKKKGAARAAPAGGNTGPAQPAVASGLPTKPAASAPVQVASLQAELPPVLRDVNVVIPRGALYAVVGSVGAGKTSLCTSILGELHRAAGHVVVNGRVAYVAQTAWILNATVKKNITFAGDAEALRADPTADVFATDAATDDDRYQRVLDACQLRHDVQTLAAGDATEIGERGINLSGGQKQRVSIARAAYADADVYVFDDPLSALDAEVGKALFSECIAGLLAGKTRLLVTNQLQYLAQCDGVIVLGQDAAGSGHIKYQGAFRDLVDTVPDFARLMAAYGHRAGSEERDDGGEDGGVPAAAASGSTPGGSTAAAGTAKQPASPLADTPLPGGAAAGGGKDAATPASPKPTGGAQLITTEEKAEGAVKLKYYLAYFGTAGNKWLIVFILMSAYIFGQLSQIVVQWWLAYWTGDPSYSAHPMGLYMGVYVALGAGVALFGFVRVVVMALVGLRASRVLHSQLVRSILHAPQVFFDTTPLGRILSRFTKDLDAIDNTLMNTISMFGMCVFFVVGALASIIFSTPWFALVIVPLVWVYLKIMTYFRNISRETKRFDAITRSPIYAHFSETLNGLSTIRAYGLVREFGGQNVDKIAANVSAWYTLRCCDRWLSIRLETLGNFIVLAAALLAVGTSSNGSTGDAAGLAGFSLSYAVAITGLLNFLVRNFAEMEQTMNSVERVTYYRDTTPQEPYEAPAGAPPPPPAWPQSGSVVFKDYHMRYRETTPEVLHGVSFGVRGGEKVGIVGRTGAGKSSIMQALFRMVQDKCHAGDILIDSVPIHSLGLSVLRANLAIIPQDPVLFSGTIRSNLDPVGSLATLPDRGDGALWDALTKVGMRDAIQRLPGGLDAAVAEFGENLSAGQRQLLCLSRVLLRNTKIVLLDEASSALDHDTDTAIQRAIRESFPASTMLIIAHRLNTIIACDRVLVMDAGVVAEFAHPHELLLRPGSIFSALVDETGPEASASLRAQAAEAYNVHRELAAAAHAPLDKQLSTRSAASAGAAAAAAGSAVALQI